MRGLIDAGVELRAFALRRVGETSLGAPAVVVVPRQLSLPSWRGLLKGTWLARRRLVSLAVDTYELRKTERHGYIATLRWASAALYIRAQLDRALPQVIHAHFGSAPASVARLLATLTQVPWGVSMHASDIYRELNHPEVKLSTASHILTCSDAARGDVARSLPIATRPRVRTVHHGIDLEQWPVRTDAAAPRQLILAAGRFVPKKGFKVLIRACALLREEQVPFSCAIVGNGPEQGSLRELAAELHLSEHVTIGPWVSPGGFQRLLSDARVFVVPSIIAPDGDRDNIPNVLIEALASGSPTVVSRLDALVRLLEANGAALLVTPGDASALARAIRCIWTHSALADEIARKGRKLVEERFDRRRTILELKAQLQLSAASQGPKAERARERALG